MGNTIANLCKTKNYQHKSRYTGGKCSVTIPTQCKNHDVKPFLLGHQLILHDAMVAADHLVALFLRRLPAPPSVISGSHTLTESDSTTSTASTENEINGHVFSKKTRHIIKKEEDNSLIV